MTTMTITSRPAFTLRPALGKSIALTGLLAALLCMPALADEAAEVTRLLRAGQHAEALSKADVFLGKNPRDAQMRFLKGVILIEQNKVPEATAVFTKLTEDFPALPEPYNNLAVLYAANGQYDKARAALDAAIRTNPSYATAYENLGDVHAKLASQAYDKALQLDSGNSGAKSKLTLLRTLVVNMNDTAGAKVAAAPKSAAASEAKPAAHSEQATNKAQPAPEHGNEDQEVLSVVQNWAQAWSAQDVKSYLDFYGSDFQTPNNQPRKAWEQERRSRIAGKSRIIVKVDAPQVVVNGDTATVKFRQTYLSDRISENTRKTLVLTRHAGKWQIKQEHAGS